MQKAVLNFNNTSSKFSESALFFNCGTDCDLSALLCLLVFLPRIITAIIHSYFILCPFKHREVLGFGSFMIRYRAPNFIYNLIFFHLFINREQDLDVGVVVVDLVLHLNNEQPFIIIVNNKINFTAIKA